MLHAKEYFKKCTMLKTNRTNSASPKARKVLLRIHHLRNKKHFDYKINSRPEGRKYAVAKHDSQQSKIFQFFFFLHLSSSIIEITDLKIILSTICAFACRVRAQIRGTGSRNSTLSNTREQLKVLVEIVP